MAPVPLTLFPIAAEAATDVIADVEQEAAPAPLIVPAWVTITNGWTDAPMLPVNPINFFQFLLPKDPNYWQLLLSFIATPHIQEIFHFRNVSNQIMKKGREEEWTDGGRRERKKEAGMEDEKRLLLSYCCRGALSADEEFSFSSVWYSLATFSSRRKKEGGGGRRRRRERSVIDFRMIDSSRGGRYEPGIDRCKPRRPNRRQLPQQQQQSSSSFGGDLVLTAMAEKRK